MRSSSVFDGFGGNATFPADKPDDFDPVAFGGQWGYYHDYSPNGGSPGGGAGLYLLTHRYYDAQAGRFVTRDPIGYKGGINLYGFAGNNPVNRRDPSGLSDLDDLFRAIDQKGQALQDSLRAGGQRIVSGVAELAEDLADDNSPDIRPDYPYDPSTYAPGDFGYEPAPKPRGPSVAFNRLHHYGRTPTTAQKRAVPKGKLFDHDPPLGQHYYEGDGKGGKPGYQMTQEERLQYARRLDVGKPATRSQRFSQGGTVKAYTERMRKSYGLPRFRKP